MKKYFFIILIVSNFTFASDNQKLSLIYDFFYSFDGIEKPVENLKKILANNFEISSSRTKINSIEKLINYFEQNKNKTIHFHLVKNIKIRSSEIYNVLIHYQTENKSMLLDYDFIFKKNKISKVKFKFKKNIKFSSSVLSTRNVNKFYINYYQTNKHIKIAPLVRKNLLYQ